MCPQCGLYAITTCQPHGSHVAILRTPHVLPTCFLHGTTTDLSVFPPLPALLPHACHMAQDDSHWTRVSPTNPSILLPFHASSTVHRCPPCDHTSLLHSQVFCLSRILKGCTQMGPAWSPTHDIPTCPPHAPCTPVTWPPCGPLSSSMAAGCWEGTLGHRDAGCAASSDPNLEMARDHRGLRIWSLRQPRARGREFQPMCCWEVTTGVCMRTTAAEPLWELGGLVQASELG